MTDLLSLTPDAARVALAEWLAARGEPAYRLRQVLPRLWQRPVERWADATDLPAALRADLDASFPLPRLETAAHQVSKDGTEKFLWKLADGEAVESVLIPEGRRRTLCISSQVGCALGCVFCATGRMGWRRDLTAGEITGQVRASEYRRRQFPRRYHQDDIVLLAGVDEAHGRLSGPATKKILEREWEVFHRSQFARLAGISVSHLYNLRQTTTYRRRCVVM